MFFDFFSYLVNFKLFEIDESRSEFYKEYKRDYFIPESGYLIFD